MKKSKSMPSDTIFALVLFFIVLLSAATTISADEMLDDIREKCSDNEMTVWGDDYDVRLFRGDEKDIDIEGREIVWFCGRKRIESYCPRNTDYVRVIWDRSREVLFECFRR